MEFYKDVKGITLFGTTKLDLNSAQYNHKAAVVTATTTANLVKIYLNDRGQQQHTFTLEPAVTNIPFTTTGIDSNKFYDYVMPIRLAAVETTTGSASTAVGRVYLFN